MRVLVEAISAEFGGIRTYVENLLRVWHQVHPEDDLLVVVPAGSTLPTYDHTRHEVHVPHPEVLGRPIIQTLTVARLAKRFNADVVLATLPATSLVRTGIPTAVVVYDLRHELRPDHFTRRRRLLRAVSYSRGYAIADRIISISQRSLDDLHRLHPRTRRTPASVVPLGADHVLDWPGSVGGGQAIAFAHQVNKNPDRIVDAWADGRRRGLGLPDLTILGTGGDRGRLAARVAAAGLTGQVTLAPFLPDEDFQQVMRAASMIVFPSDFEGFGLPVIEGMLLGAPVVIGPEPACLEVAGGFASVLDEWTPAGLADAVVRARDFDAAHLERARAHAEEFTWRRCAEHTRSILAGIAPAADRR